MPAENEIVRLALGSIHSLAAILNNYYLPKDLQQIVDFTESNFKRLESSKALSHKIEPKSGLSHSALATQIISALWHVLSIGRVYNRLYLKGKKPRDFIRETISYDKELGKENANETDQEGTA